MGDFADDVDALSGLYEDVIYELEHIYYEMQEELSERKSGNKTNKHSGLWKTKNGQQIKICDMTDTHLENTIKYLERKLEFLYS